ncbi:MAG: hypothetical protein KME04_08530 [Pleurocapsa minor GSE-CHR-MK-17-07R]|jgi:hypothetical protein|nr:hypothetical protein [Pleurocapsa minor GSE-CHR-MK 17-07R]
MRFEFDRDYIFIYGPEWADELEDCLRRDALAMRVMNRLNLTFADIRRYYLAKPYFQRVRAWLLDQADRTIDPVELLLTAVCQEKATSSRRAG